MNNQTNNSHTKLFLRFVANLDTLRVIKSLVVAIVCLAIAFTCFLACVEEDGSINNNWFAFIGLMICCGLAAKFLAAAMTFNDMRRANKEKREEYTWH